MLAFEGFYETERFKHLANHVFRSPLFEKYISFQGHLFFQVLKI